jgi:tRNA (guanine37-N1)-methyltransferase
MFPGPLAHSLAGRGLEQGVWSLETVNIRDHGLGKHRVVDDTPFGGGAGMVIRPDVTESAVQAARALVPPTTPALYLSPRGRAFDQDIAKALAAGPGVLLLCGRYEGVDQRAIEALELEEVSIGDYVLSGGEPAALVLLDTCIRLLPGILGNAETVLEESFESGLLEYPHFTRPAVWRDRAGQDWPVPSVLSGGHHGQIADWRRSQAEALTQQRRPDLWQRHKAAK